MELNSVKAICVKVNLCSSKRVKLQRKICHWNNPDESRHAITVESFWLLVSWNTAHQSKLFSSRKGSLCADDTVAVSDQFCALRNALFLPSKLENIKMSVLLFRCRISFWPPVFIKKSDKNNYTWPFWRVIKITFRNNQIVVYQ